MSIIYEETPAVEIRLTKTYGGGKPVGIVKGRFTNGKGICYCYLGIALNIPKRVGIYIEFSTAKKENLNRA